jgi:hypothetical protein
LYRIASPRPLDFCSAASKADFFSSWLGLMVPLPCEELESMSAGI